MDLSKIRNIAVIGPSGAGKTTLVDALLLDCGTHVDRGSIEQGTTTTDFDDEEIRRHHSIGTAWANASFEGYELNFIDTPGKGDFQVDMRFGLWGADAALLILDATRGVDATSCKLFKMAHDRQLPVAIFVNKVHAEKFSDYGGLLHSLKEHLSVATIPFVLPIGSGLAFKGVIDLVNPADVPPEMQEAVNKAATALIETVAETDEALLNKYLEQGTLSPDERVENLRKGVLSGAIVPVYCGEAKENLGLKEILAGLLAFLPAPPDRPPIAIKDLDSDQTTQWTHDPAKPAGAFVFKTISDPFVGKISIFRVFSGEIKQDDTLRDANRNAGERIGKLFKLVGKKQVPTDRLLAGEIGAVAKLKETLTGDTLVAGSRNFAVDHGAMVPAIFSVAIAPRAKGEETKLAEALRRLEEEDPSLHHSAEPATHRTVLSGQGQAHLDVTIDRLKNRFHLDVAVFEPKIPYRETVTAKAEGQGRHKKQTGGRGQFGDCWLRIEPLGRGEGFRFLDEIKGGVIPNQFIPAVEKGVREICEEGVLAGYPIVDVQVAVYFGSYHSVDSSEMAFKVAAHLAMKKIFPEAKPVILEPILSVTIQVPEETVGD
ncbi:MAG: elongation factor G, partial [Cyanobacteria bacterium REEB65]|nr:elongation factor G [Cyanobacteria bacterium REEB65]